MTRWQAGCWSFVLVCTLSCTDRGVVGDDCPDAGCTAVAPSEPVVAPPPAVSRDAAVSGVVDAGCGDAAAKGCKMSQVGDVCVATRDAGCCVSDLDCKIDDEVFCHLQQHRCVECLEDAHCSGRSGEPFCVDHECKSCANEAACRSEMQCEGNCEDER